MRGCAGIAALNALRHPRARVSTKSRTRASKPKDQKQKKSNPREIKTRKNPTQEKSKARKSKAQAQEATLCPADPSASLRAGSRGGCPYVGHFGIA
jgi:hypothetical protein